jgi:hypothetical protein
LNKIFEGSERNQGQKAFDSSRFLAETPKIQGWNTKNPVQTFSNKSYETIFVITYLQKLRAS